MPHVNALPIFHIMTNRSGKSEKKERSRSQLSILALSAIVFPALAAITYVSFREIWTQKNERGSIENKGNSLNPLPKIPYKGFNFEGNGLFSEPFVENQICPLLPADLQATYRNTSIDKVVESVLKVSRLTSEPVILKTFESCKNETIQPDQKQTENSNAPYDYIKNLGCFGLGIAFTYVYHLRKCRSVMHKMEAEKSDVERAKNDLVEEHEKTIEKLNEEKDKEIKDIKKILETQEAKLGEIIANHNVSLRDLRRKSYEELDKIIREHRNFKETGKEKIKETPNDLFVETPLPEDIENLRKELETSFKDLTEEVSRKENENHDLREKNQRLIENLENALKISGEATKALGETALIKDDTRIVREEMEKQSKLLKNLLKIKEKFKLLKEEQKNLIAKNEKLELEQQEEIKKLKENLIKRENLFKKDKEANIGLLKASHQEQIEKYNKKIQSLNEKLKNEKSEQEREIDCLNEKMIANEKEIDRLNKILSRKKAKLKENNQKISSLQENILEKDEEMENLKIRMNELYVTLNELLEESGKDGEDLNKQL